MLEIYSISQSEQWDSIVRTFKNYDTYWLSGYVKAFQLHGDGEPLLFYFNDNNTRAINVVMKRDISKVYSLKGRIEENKYFDFATPYGYGGWLVEGDNLEKLFFEYRKWNEDNNIISEFVRFHPMIKNHNTCLDFYDVVKLGEVVHMDLYSQEDIWKNITSSNRNMIRKAIKNDVKIYNGRYPEIYEVFRRIYNETMDNDEAKEYYYFGESFYKSVLEDLPYNSQVFWAEKDGIIIGTSIMLMANGRMNYHLSGSLREYRNLASTNYLLYSAALWGSSNGYQTLYLGGGVGSGEDSLFKFKRSFYRGELNHFYIGKKIYNMERYNEFTTLSLVGETGFFPSYRG